MNAPQRPRSDQRRETLRQRIPRPPATLRQAIKRPEFVRTSAIILVFLILASLLVAWGREQTLVVPGRIVKDSRLTRQDYEHENIAATESRRSEAAAASPFIYVPNAAVLDRLESSLMGLPTAVAGTDSLTAVADELKADFGLTESTLQAVRPFAGPGGPTDAWTSWSDALVHNALIHGPILDPETFQLFSTQAATNRALELPGGSMEQPFRGEALNVTSLENQTIPPRLLEIVRRAGFPESLVNIVAYRVAQEARPTLKLDREKTQALRDAAAEAVEPTMVKHTAGTPLYRRGDRLTQLQLDEVRRESAMYAAQSSWTARWIPRIGMGLLVAAMSCFLGAFTMMTYRRIARNPMRLMAVCLLVILMLSITVLVSVDSPGIMVAAAFGPLLFSTAVLRLAYDRRLATAVAGMQAAILVIALQENIGWFVLLMGVAMTLIAQLAEVRSRVDLIRASSIAATTAAVGTIVLGMIEYPAFGAAIGQLLVDGVQAGLATIGVGFLILGILPSIERLFHITTGMTLAELRDPRRPLLRELQQRAPGTWDHSLQVASIAEAAAEAIGANGLMCYVGGLYHDIGKMHKPHYFIENQHGGDNPHDSLSPAMSLLVIIGHVKDGIELAREYRVPREIIHFIESHHGTTLVEYFYHAAKQRAEEGGDKESPQEVEFRYPGPKPTTRETAILMLSDCVESATRAMHDPTPAQVEGLVHDLAQKRLLDGQFDDCPMTLAELNKVKESILTRVCAIHHGRIAYPEEDGALADTEHSSSSTGSEATATS